MFSDELQMCSGHRGDAGCAVLHAVMTGVAGQTHSVWFMVVCVSVRSQFTLIVCELIFDMTLKQPAAKCPITFEPLAFSCSAFKDVCHTVSLFFISLIS